MRASTINKHTDKYMYMYTYTVNWLVTVVYNCIVEPPQLIKGIYIYMFTHCIQHIVISVISVIVLSVIDD